MSDHDREAYRWTDSIFGSAYPTYPTDMPYNPPTYPSMAAYQDDRNYCSGYGAEYCGNPSATEYGYGGNYAQMMHTMQDDFSHMRVTEYPGNYPAPSCYSGQCYGSEYGSNSSMLNPLASYYGGSFYQSSYDPSSYGGFSNSSVQLLEEKPQEEEQPPEEQTPADQQSSEKDSPSKKGSPSTKTSSSDYDRLRERLEMYNMVEHKVLGDGNCQFRALSHQLYQTDSKYQSVREKIVDQLRTKSKLYKSHVSMEYDEYLTKMLMDGEWGDHITLQAAADAFKVKIKLITSYKNTCCIDILPNKHKAKKVLFLSFIAEAHYNSIICEGESSLSKPEKKKGMKFFW